MSRGVTAEIPSVSKRDFMAGKGDREVQVLERRSRDKFTDSIKKSIERVSNHIRGKSKEELTHEMKLCSVAMNHRKQLGELVLKLEIKLIRRPFQAFLSSLRRPQAVAACLPRLVLALEKALVRAAFRKLTAPPAWVMMTPSTSPSPAAALRKGHSRNLSVAVPAQPSIRLAQRIRQQAGTRGRHLREITADQERLKRFAAATRIQVGFHRYKFQRYLQAGAQPAVATEPQEEEKRCVIV